MGASSISKVILWVTVTWVILVSYPRKASAGPLTFAVCVTEAAGPICAASAATATAACAATAFIPPLWCACMSGFMVVSCGATCVLCASSFFAPTP